MNYFDKLLNKCNMENIVGFLQSDTDNEEKQSETCYERHQNAYKMLNDWLEEHFPDFKEYNKESCCLSLIACEIEDVCFQMGLQAGIMLAIDFYKKMNE